MRCEKCKQYVPEGLGIKNCPNCGFEITENSNVLETTNSDTKTDKPNSLSEQINKRTKESKLTKDQIARIENRINKGRNRLIIVSIIMTLLIIASFIIPVGFLPSKRSYRLYDMDKSLTLSQSIGILPTLILLTILGCLFFIIVLRHTKYFKLKKDLIDGVILTFETKINRIRELAGDAEKEYDVYLEQNDANLDKLNYLISEFPNIQAGDFIRVTLTQNAKFVLSTEKLNIRNRL